MGEGTMVVCLSGLQLSSRSTRASFNRVFTLGLFLGNLLSLTNPNIIVDTAIQSTSLMDATRSW